MSYDNTDNVVLIGYMGCGKSTVGSFLSMVYGYDFIDTFIYPTKFHFISSILVLYIPFYFVMKIEPLKSRIPVVIAVIFSIQMLVYILFYDKTTYHIDSVYEYMVKFLYFIAMLMGAYVRVNDIKFRSKSRIINAVLILPLGAAYFASKMFFVKFSNNTTVSQFQIINQIILLALVYYIFVFTAGMDKKLEKLPGTIKSIINFIGSMTLEIYMVQDVLVPQCNIGAFPINWIFITLAIAIASFALHLVSDKVISKISRIVRM